MHEMNDEISQKLVNLCYLIQESGRDDTNIEDVKQYLRETDADYEEFQSDDILNGVARAIVASAQSIVKMTAENYEPLYKMQTLEPLNKIVPPELLTRKSLSELTIDAFRAGFHPKNVSEIVKYFDKLAENDRHYINSRQMLADMVNIFYIDNAAYFDDIFNKLTEFNLYFRANTQESQA